MDKKIIYIDMDGVIADFVGGVRQIDPDVDCKLWTAHVDALCQQNPYIFHDLPPIEGAIDAVKKLFEYYDIYFLSAPMWCVPLSFSGKRIWLEKHFGELAKHKLVLTHRKDLNIGDYLVDDTTRYGAGEFTGMHIHYATPRFPDWNAILEYLIAEYHKHKQQSNTHAQTHAAS